MNDKHILITGITGFIGRHLYRFLNKNYPSCRVTGISKQYFPHCNEYFCADLTQRTEVENAITKLRPDYIFHLAGLVYSYDWQELYLNNVMATINLIEAVEKLEYSCKIIITGSAAEYGTVQKEFLPITELYATQPQTPYGMSKLWQTQIAQYYQSKGISISIARIFNIIAHDVDEKLSIGRLLSQVRRIMDSKQFAPVKIGCLEMKRDFLDIEDVCAALVLMAKSKKQGESYNICSGHSTSLNEILELMLELTNLNPSIQVDNTQQQNTYAMDVYGSFSKIQEDLQWSPKISLIESLKRALFTI